MRKIFERAEEWYTYYMENKGTPMSIENRMEFLETIVDANIRILRDIAAEVYRRKYEEMGIMKARSHSGLIGEL